MATALPAPADAANTFAPTAYLEYAGLWGDTYNGVTTDDGDHLAGSYTALGRVDYGRFTASLMFQRVSTRSVTNATTPAGAPGTALAYPSGQVIVPLFTAVNSESEIRLEYEPPAWPVYLGLAYSLSSNNYNFPALKAFGVGVELQPNPRHALSPYGSYFYFPNQTGTYPLADPNNPNSGSYQSSYRANELTLGASLRIPRTHLTLVGGYKQTTNVARVSSFNFVQDGPFLGLGYRLR